MILSWEDLCESSLGMGRFWQYLSFYVNICREMTLSEVVAIGN